MHLELIPKPKTIWIPQWQGTLLALALLTLVAGMVPAEAQTAVMPALSDLQDQAQTAKKTSQLSDNAQSATDVPTFLQWGSVIARPRASYRFVSATGLQAKPGKAVDTTIQTFSPGITLDLSSHWSLDYQAAWNVYSQRDFKDTLDHSLVLRGATSYESWSFNAMQGYSHSSEPLIETGQQTTEDLYTTGFTATDRLNSHIILETDVNQSLRYTTDFNDTKEWSLLEWAHFQFSPKLDTALGVGPGYVEIRNGSDMNYYKFLGSIDWRPGETLSVHLDGGLDHRRVRTGKANYTNDPIATASIGYKMFEQTVLSLEAARTVTASYFSNHVQKSFRWNVGLNQRLLGHLNLILGAGYQKSSYDKADPSSANARDDKDWWYIGRLSTVVLKQGTISVFYQYTKNTSSVPGYGFSSDQTGLELRYQY